MGAADQRSLHANFKIRVVGHEGVGGFTPFAVALIARVLIEMKVCHGGPGGHLTTQFVPALYCLSALRCIIAVLQ